MLTWLMQRNPVYLHNDSVIFAQKKILSHFSGFKVVKCATTARLSHVNVCRIAGSSKERAVSGLACLGFGNNKFIYKVNYTAPQVVVEHLTNHQEKQLILWYLT